MGKGSGEWKESTHWKSVTQTTPGSRAQKAWVPNKEHVWNLTSIWLIPSERKEPWNHGPFLAAEGLNATGNQVTLTTVQTFICFFCSRMRSLRINK